MRKYAGLMLMVCALVMLSVTGCENSGSELIGAIMSGFAQTFAGTSGDVENLNFDTSGVSIAGMSAAGITTQALTSGTSGWITLAVTGAQTTINIQYRFLYIDGTPIEESTITAIYTEADANAKTMEFQEEITSVNGTFECDLTFTRTTIGAKGGTMSGTASGVGPNGGTVAATFTAVAGKGDGSRICTGGNIAATYTSPLSKIWSVSLSFNTDGSADGSIDGNNYSGTLHLDPNGSGSYTDDTGTHELTAPTSATS